MLKFKRVYQFAKLKPKPKRINWPLVDLIDYNHQVVLTKTAPPKVDLTSILGSNYERYAQSSLQLEYTSHINEPTEIKVLSQEHPHFKLNDRIFPTFTDLKKVREAETLQQQKFVLKELEEPDLFTIDAMQSYKPRLTCDNLTNQQLILINIPINASVEEIQQFVKQQTNQIALVKIETCSLNLNAFAIITFNQPAEQFKQKLHLQRFKGILQECKSLEDTGDENPFNRTLVITNIDRTQTFQEVLHLVGQYGRVINAVVPLEVINPDLPLYSDIIDTLTEPCKLEVLNVQTGQIEIDFFPSFEQFEETYKNYPEYYDPNLEKTLLEIQQQQDTKQNHYRLFRLLNQKTVKCLKVPEHLKDSYKKLWIPPVNTEKPQECIEQQLYAKSYQNRGYCVCTFSSKTMAQRALQAINYEGTMDLAKLPLPLMNTPRFISQHVSHSKQRRFGGKFRIENLSGSPLRAMKSWENMELYQIDLVYNLKHLEKIRKIISEVRDQTLRAVQIEQNSLQKLEEKKQKLHQRVYSELNKSPDFKSFVEKNSFATTLNQFQDGLPVEEEETSGRKFDLDITNSQYEKFVNVIKERAQSINLKQSEYADKLVEKYQTLFLDDEFERQAEKRIHKHPDNLIQLMQSRLISGYKEHEASDEAIQTMSDVITNNIEELQKTAADEREANIYFGVLKDKHRVIGNPKEAAKRQAEKIKRMKGRFSVLVTNPAFLKKQALLQHDRFLDQIKHLLLGEEYEHEQFIAIHPLAHKDQLKVTLALAKDNLGKEFLNEEIIKYVREFDIPEGQDKLIKEQEKNRKELMSQITKNMISRLKFFGRETYTQKLIHYDQYGLPTETFEVTDEKVDLDQMVKDLNDLVAVGSEKYGQVTDPLTKKKYIVKTEKPFIKYDLDAFDLKKEGGFDSLESEFITILSQNGYSIEQANKLLSSLEIDGNVPEELLDLIDSLPEEDYSNIEEVNKREGLTRKQIELAQSLDFRNNLDEIKTNANQQAYLKEITKKYAPITDKTYIRDSIENLLKIRKNGKFIIPKIKKY